MSIQRSYLEFSNVTQATNYLTLIEETLGGNTWGSVEQYVFEESIIYYIKLNPAYPQIDERLDPERKNVPTVVTLNTRTGTIEDSHTALTRHPMFDWRTGELRGNDPIRPGGGGGEA